MSYQARIIYSEIYSVSMIFRTENHPFFWVPEIAAESSRLSSQHTGHSRHHSGGAKKWVTFSISD